MLCQAEWLREGDKGQPGRVAVELQGCETDEWREEGSGGECGCVCRRLDGDAAMTARGYIWDDVVGGLRDAEERRLNVESERQYRNSAQSGLIVDGEWRERERDESAGFRHAARRSLPLQLSSSNPRRGLGRLSTAHRPKRETRRTRLGALTNPGTDGRLALRRLSQATCRLKKIILGDWYFASASQTKLDFGFLGKVRCALEVSRP